ncbi:MAG: hypothetical protein RR448_04625 [Niameybacter sp.]|uniref:hypothetical protein n=1 Tax=Niameybacter sp. TaxID=2033640 RepID=UPI002FCC83A5
MQALLILFVALVVASGLGIAFLFLTKNKKVQNGLFYFLVILGMFIAFINATSFPSNYIVQAIVAWGFGFLSIVALIVKMKKLKNENIAKYIVSASLILGLLQLLF